MVVTDSTPGSSLAAYSLLPVDFLYLSRSFNVCCVSVPLCAVWVARGCLRGGLSHQSRMRPTKGEIRVALASAAATAWAKEKRSVMLQWMPSFSRVRAAWMPSQVVASWWRMMTAVCVCLEEEQQ